MTQAQESWEDGHPITAVLRIFALSPDQMEDDEVMHIAFHNTGCKVCDSDVARVKEREALLVGR
jgi:hypothetical protein